MAGSSPSARTGISDVSGDLYHPAVSPISGKNRFRRVWDAPPTPQKRCHADRLRVVLVRGKRTAEYRRSRRNQIGRHLATTRFLDGVTESQAETLATCGVDVSPSRYVTEFVLVFEYGDGTAEDSASRH
jgi:hypothetical protein